MNTAKKILVVDDEIDLVDALSFDFKRKGFDVYCAYNGKEAFEIVEKQKIDLIISDIRMPGGDGIELLQKVKKIPNPPKLIFSTGFSEIGMDEAFDLGAEDVVAKPFERKELHSKIELALKDFQKKYSEVKVCNDHFIQVKPDAVTLGRGGVHLVLDLGENISAGKEILFEVNFLKSFKVKAHGRVKYIHKMEGRKIGVGVEYLALEGDVLEYEDHVKNILPFIPKRNK